MQEVNLYRFGFVLYVNSKSPDQYLSYIGSKYSTEEKIKGHVKFKAKDLPFSHNYKYIYLVRYTVDVQEHAGKIECVYKLERNQYKGVLSVDGTGEVFFTKKGTSTPVSLSHGSMDPVETTTTQKMTPITTEGVPELSGSSRLPFNLAEDEIQWKEDASGNKIAECNIPFDKVLMSGDGENRTIGFVNYYIPSMSVFIRGSYENRHYVQNPENENDMLAIFKPFEELPDYSLTGAVKTGKFLYIVSFRYSGAYAPDPRDADAPQLAVATDVTFLEKIEHRKAIRCTRNGDTLCMSFYVQGNTGVVTELSNGPSAGQSVEGYLNQVVSVCLHEGRMEEGLRVVEQYGSSVSVEKYQTIRLRLLQRLYKDTQSPAFRKEMLSCIDSLLPIVSKANFRLTLLVEKGTLQMHDGERKQALETFQSWMQHYREYITANPDMEKGLQPFLRRVEKSIAYCSGEEEEQKIAGDAEGQDNRRADFFDEDLENEQYYETELHDCIVEKMANSSCEVFGEEYKRFDDLDDLETLKMITKEDADALRIFLEEKSDAVEARELWALAKVYSNLKIYSNLENTHIEVIKMIEEIGASAKRDELICKALNTESIGLIRKVDDFRTNSRTAHFYSLLTLSLRANKTDIVAALGALCLKEDEFRSALQGGMSLGDVLSVAMNRHKMKDVVEGMIEICHFNSVAREEIGLFLDDKMATSTEAYAKKFWDTLTGFQPGKDSVPQGQLFSSIAANFKRFYDTMSMPQAADRIPEVAVGQLDILAKEENLFWLRKDNGPVTTDALRDIYRPLRDYETMKGFPQKSRLLRDALTSIHEVKKKIDNFPTYISYHLYLPKLEDYERRLLTTYKNLCQTTRPILKVGSCEEVETRPEGNLVLTIPVMSNTNNAQDALNVKLTIRTGDEDEFVLKAENAVHVVDNLPGDGRKVLTTVPIRLKDPKTTVLSIGVRLSYDYIGDVKIDAIKRFIKGRKRYGYKDVRKKAHVPNETGWVNLDVTVESSHERRELSLDRVNKFTNDGVVKWDDEGVRKILQNRQKQIDSAINALTVTDTGKDGITCRKLRDQGRWVILYGQWRVGKTVILNCIEERLADKDVYPNAVVLNVTCSGSDQPDFESSFAKDIYVALRLKMRKHDYNTIFEEAREYWGIDMKGDNITWDLLSNFLATFHEDIRQKDDDAAVVLLVDEFTEIYQAIIRGSAGDRFPQRWADLIDKTNLLCVTAGGEHTVSLMETYTPNTLQKAEERIYVQYLTKENVNDYVRYVFFEAPEDNVPRENSYFSTSSDVALDRIYELTRGNAFLLKNYCVWLINYIQEKKKPFLTKNIVNETLDSIVGGETTDVDSLETLYFNSLYNPFNETREKTGTAEGVRRIEDDQVREDNLKILHTIVELADRDTHKCTYAELAERVQTKMQPEVFQKRFNTLKTRRIIEMDSNRNVSVFIDLYYEIVSRIGGSTAYDTV